MFNHAWSDQGTLIIFGIYVFSQELHLAQEVTMLLYMEKRPIIVVVCRMAYLVSLAAHILISKIRPSI